MIRTRPASPIAVAASRLLPLALALAALGCGEVARLPDTAGYGPKPELPPPRETMLPTVAIAPAVGWPEGRTPTAAEGMRVQAFATGLAHPRWLHVLPNGDVLVAESDRPAPPADAPSGGLRAG